MLTWRMSGCIGMLVPCLVLTRQVSQPRRGQTFDKFVWVFLPPPVTRGGHCTGCTGGDTRDSFYWINQTPLMAGEGGAPRPAPPRHNITSHLQWSSGQSAAVGQHCPCVDTRMFCPLNFPRDSCWCIVTRAVTCHDATSSTSRVSRAAVLTCM